MMHSAIQADLQRSCEGWISRYQALVELMYEVRRRCPQLPVLGVSVLHPRHPLPPDQLQVLETLTEEYPSSEPVGHAAPGKGRRPFPSLMRLLLQWLWCVLYASRESIGLLGLKLQVGSCLRRMTREGTAVLIKTWCFGPTSLDPTADFYFGTLPHELAKRGVGCVVLYGDRREKHDGAFARAVIRQTPFRAVPEQALIPLWAPFVTVCRQLVSALQLRRVMRKVPSTPLAAVCAVASIESVQPITMRNTLSFYIARAAVKRWGARAFITLYEGQPWEKPAWHGAKAADPRCLIVGYQHTVVLPHSLSVLSPPRIGGEVAVPDIVLCLGEATRTMLRDGHQPYGNQLVPFGTFRRGHNGGDTPGPEPGRRTVLVLPEGLSQEARLLFNVAMQAAALLPDYRFIFRSHPALPFDQVRSSLADCPERFSNVTLSQGTSLSDDFDRSSHVLYRGSSTVWYAILHGLKPLYLHDERSPDIDPLLDLRGWRERISSPGEVAQHLRQDAVRARDEAVAEWQDAVRYVDTYTVAVDAAAIGRLLTAIGISQEGRRP